jgi:hypothetical protein
LYKEQQAKEIKAPPSFFTRQQDHMPLPPINAYCKAYEKLMACTYTSTAAVTFNFVALNRTVWTEKKQSLSGNPGVVGRMNRLTMVHVICVATLKTLHTSLRTAIHTLIDFGNVSTNT